jgi:hypothetical protein
MYLTEIVLEGLGFIPLPEDSLRPSGGLQWTQQCTLGSIKDGEFLE